MTPKALPTGTLSFMFTDVESSTRMWERHDAEMDAALGVHDEILRSEIEDEGGYVFSTAGDAFAAAFESAVAARRAALAIQGRLAAVEWPTPEPIRVRMGLHVGEAHERASNFFGPTLNRTGRIMSTASGGQIVASAAFAEVVGTETMMDLGSHRLKDLGAAEHLWQVNSGSFRPIRSLDAAHHNLPVERTPLIGRSEEVAEIAELLTQHRLVTLLGIGGSGKTRLASAVGAEIVDRFGDGVWFVDLVPATDHTQTVEAIAGAAGLQVSGDDLLGAIVEVLARREVLFVLDNCEHVTDDVADVVEVLLESTSSLRVLATSREPLQLFDERQVQVSPLAVGDDFDSPAVAMFVASADRVGIRIDEAASVHVARICAQVDGHPLSLELAAAQLRQLSISELADRLDQRFKLLTQRRSGRGRRHASLLGVLDDTWSMLNRAESELLLELAAFPSTFIIDDVESVAHDLDVMAPSTALAGLVDHGLVTRDADSGHRLLETVKLFGRDRWQRTPDPGQYEARHTRWVIESLSSYSLEEHATSYEMILWADAHYEDHRVVEHRLAASDRVVELVELVSSLGSFYGTSTAPQAAGVADRIDSYLAAFRLDDRQRGLLSLVAARSGIPTRDHGRIAERSDDAVRLLRRDGAPEELSFALIVNSFMAVFRDPVMALANLDEAANIANAAAAPALADVATGYRLFALSILGRLDDVPDQLGRLRKRIDGRPYDHAWNLYFHQQVAANLLTNPDVARRALAEWSEQSAGTSVEVGTMFAKTLVYCLAAAASDDVDHTRELLNECQDLVRRTTVDDGLPDLLLPLVALAWTRGETDRARRWLTTIRRSPRPLINLPLGIHFRRLRDTIGLDPISDGDLTADYRAAIDWLAATSSSSEEGTRAGIDA